CYPVAGCVGYRGYFSEQAAQEKARELQKQGYETHVGGITAYSTLGWFDDPVLNTFAFHKQDRLVSLIFHESAHKKLYVKDDTLFNESFATAVEQEGLRRWQLRHSDKASVSDPEAQWSQQLNLLLMKYRERLATLYDSDLSTSVKRNRKKQIFQALHQAYSALKVQLGMDQRYDAWMSTINNAKLATVSDYHRFVPAFARMMARAGSLSTFYSAVSQLAEQDRNSRNKQLERLLMESAE
ncbi:MAG: aminopeptidase, partial [Endozoicomonas sp.]